MDRKNPHLVSLHFSGLTPPPTCKFLPITPCHRKKFYNIFLRAFLMHFLHFIFNLSCTNVRTCHYCKGTSTHAPLRPPVSCSQLDNLPLSFVPALALTSSLGELIQPAKWEENCALHLLYWFAPSTGAEGRDAAGSGGWRGLWQPDSPLRWQWIARSDKFNLQNLTFSPSPLWLLPLGHSSPSWLYGFLPFPKLLCFLQVSHLSFR